ncbi:MAG: hypothetical protein VKO00_05875 [Cyanobacteriota bacterium]|nr:hypothetical protein [Cyanobacteriota bacterium]
MALRRHRLPRLWLALTLGAVAAAMSLAYWWERQLPQRLQQAAASGRLDDCIRYGEQLAALRWLPGSTPLDQSQCRRQRARQLWQVSRWSEALLLQRQLLASAAAGPADRRQLQEWEEELRRRALELYQQGDLAGAQRLLQPIGQQRRGDGSRLGDEMEQAWTRNRVHLERAERLVRQSRWWEALDALNRLDHPLWQERSAGLRRQVTAAISAPSPGRRQHNSHGTLPHTVPAAELDAAVRQRIAAGQNEWEAYQSACRQLGGRVVEAGPESACQR